MGFLKHFSQCRRYLCNKPKPEIMKYLNVAEKNDAAKNIAIILSRGTSTRREGLSNYNKIYEFDAVVNGQQSRMVMTSVSGHLLTYEFAASFRGWRSCDPVALFDAPVAKSCPEDYVRIKRTLEREIRSCQGLIVWTDCDREGENIGFEIITVCTAVKNNLTIFRAKFSEITRAAITRALNNLEQPNKNVSDAVDVRSELDLRTGAAFTRLQTLRLQKVFPQELTDKLISYGSCQFPTLGFVVDRYKAIEDFISERFWRIKMNHTVKELTTDFNWQRDRLFDKNATEAILDICKENPTATVESIENKPKNKWRPLPLDTVEMEKNISRKLRINAKEVMKIAEKLYTQGFISYPRTETNIFPRDFNLTNLVEQQRADTRWGAFAERVLNDGGPNPRQGKKSDQAHPPIHPTKHAPNLTGNEQRVYEYVVRHFLACVSKDAVGHETVVVADISGEKFTARGLVVLERNYLDVYIYEKWNGKEIYSYERGDTFDPTELDIVESSTQPPKLLTEADLIALMERHGIGTDATHADHIDTIKSREYVGLQENLYFVPGSLGMGLVEGYDSIGLEVSLAKPRLRAEFELDLKAICDGAKDPEAVRRDQIAKYRATFEAVAGAARRLDDSLGARLGVRPAAYRADELAAVRLRPVLKCPRCGGDMVVRDRKNQPGKYVSCVAYPGCANVVWFTGNVESIEVLDESCPECGPNVKKVRMKFKQNMFPGYPNPQVLCVGGCDENVLTTLGINPSNVRPSRNTSTTTSTDTQRNPIPNLTSQNRNTRPTDRPRPQPKKTNTNTNTRTFLNTSTTSTGRNNSFLHPSPRASGSNSFPQSPNNNDNGDDDVMCSCGQVTIRRTVVKDGPNKGRVFHKCSSGACDFFLWAPSESEITQPDNRGQQNPGNMICNCHLPVVQRTVNKDGPNKGRQFYTCSKPIGKSCNFFKWADEDDGGGGGGWGAGGGGGGGGWGGGGGGGGGGWNGGGNGRGKKRKKNNFKGNANRNKRTKGGAAGDKTRAKRKCGICGQEGHTRTNCPEK